MPIPKPKKNEEKNEFISRCMSDEVMVKEYPNSRQRAAICYDSWSKSIDNSMFKVMSILRESRIKKVL